QPPPADQVQASSQPPPADQPPASDQPQRDDQPQAPVLQSITIDQGDTSIVVGGQQQFTATGTFSDGTRPLPGPLTWSSSAPDVVAIDPSSGLATAQPVSGSAQTAQITITDTATGIPSAPITVSVAALSSSNQPKPQGEGDGIASPVHFELPDAKVPFEVSMLKGELSFQAEITLEIAGGTGPVEVGPTSDVGAQLDIELAKQENVKIIGSIRFEEL